VPIPSELWFVTLPLIVTITVAVIGAVWSNNHHLDRGFEQMNKRMDEMSNRMDDISATLRAIESI
jgi:hypothetical protein